VPRTLSATIQCGMLAQQTGVIGLQILTIEHDDLAAPIRLVNNREDISVNGTVFTACQFHINAPEEKEEGLPRAQIVIDNTDQFLTPTIRSLSGEFTATYQIVSPTDLTASPPEFDTVEVSMLPFDLTSVEYDDVSVRGNLSYEDVLDRQFPEMTYTPNRFKGLY
jgi:hypothetical protein